MNRDTVRAMLKALPNTREDGNSVIFDPTNWAITLYAGRGGQAVSVEQVTKVTVETDFLIAETQREQRFVLVMEDVRGFAAEPCASDRRGRKTGFV